MFFDGGREDKRVSLAGKKKARANPQETAQKSMQAKIQREMEMKRYRSAILIQKVCRSFIAVMRSKASACLEFDNLLEGFTLQHADIDIPVLITLSRRLCFFYRAVDGSSRLVRLARLLGTSIAANRHHDGWQQLWIQHTPLLRAMLTAMFSYLLQALHGRADPSGADIVGATLESILTNSQQTVPPELLSAQMKLVTVVHVDIYAIVQQMLSGGMGHVGVSVVCGAAVSAFVSFVNRVLTACEHLTGDHLKIEKFNEVKESILQKVAVSILSAPMAGRSPIAGPVLALFANDGFKMWLECAQRMRDKLASMLRLVEEAGAGYSALFQFVLFSSRISKHSKKISTGDSIATDKFGRPTAVLAEVAISCEHRNHTIMSILHFMANVTDLPQFSDLSNASKFVTIQHNTDGTILHLLSLWISLANQLLTQSSVYRLPLHAAIYYLDYLHSATDDANNIPSLVAHVDQGVISLLPVSASHTITSHPIIVTDSDEMDIIREEEVKGMSNNPQIAVAGRIGGFYVEHAIKPLFDSAAFAEIDVWNDIYDSVSRSSLLRVLLFSTSGIISGILQTSTSSSYNEPSSKGPGIGDSASNTEEFKLERQDALNNIQLQIVSLLASLISSSENPLPGTKISSNGLKVTELHTAHKRNSFYSDSIGKIISSLAFSTPETPMIKCLWKQFSSSSLSTDVSHQMLLNSKAKSSNSVNKVSICSGTSILYVICVVLSHQLIALQDDELYAGKKSIDPNAGDLEKILEILKDSIYHLTWITPVLLLPFTDVVDNLSQTRYWNDPLLSHRFRRIALLQAVTRLYNHLSIRNERRGYILSSVGDALSRSTYLPPLQWTWDLARHAGAVRSDVYQPRTGVNGFITGVETRRAVGSAEPTDSAVSASDLWDLGDDANFKFLDSRIQIILLNSPQVISFEQRAVVLHALIASDQDEHQVHSFGMMRAGDELIRIRRNEIIRDAYDALNAATVEKMKQKLRVVFTSEDGHVEAGIDGGGLFKEFLESFMKTAFDPESKYFATTETHELVPNSLDNVSPTAISAKLDYYKFMGKMLAKAVYSEILLEPQFSPVFLNLLLGRTNSIDDMSYLDAQFYKSLMNIKQMILRGEDIEELGLTFQTTAGEALIPGGREAVVTKANALTYIYLLAKHKLNISVHASKAFLSGFREIIPVSWLQMFNPREMQSILGGELRPLDLEDLKRNVSYSGGYHPSQPYVQMFWDVVAEFSPQEQGDFLKFITSCSRQPLLGFDKLNPKIGIQEVPARYPDDPLNSAPRLPSAGTCFNLLKLPRYESRDILREKLKYAIKCNTGFELS